VGGSWRGVGGGRWCKGMSWGKRRSRILGGREGGGGGGGGGGRSPKSSTSVVVYPIVALSQEE